GSTIPALMGEVKPTFHNIFAHPLWLYTPDLADRAYRVSARLEAGHIAVTHDWALSDLRQRFLDLKRDRYWKPLLRRLRQIEGLPVDWETILCLALFCCPTLVMSQLPSAERSPFISLLGFAIAVMCGSPPEGEGSDVVSAFFAELHRALT